MRHPLAVNTGNPLDPMVAAHFLRAEQLLERCRKAGLPQERAISVLSCRLKSGLTTIDGVLSTQMVLDAVKSIIAGENIASDGKDLDEVSM